MIWTQQAAEQLCSKMGQRSVNSQTWTPQVSRRESPVWLRAIAWCDVWRHTTITSDLHDTRLLKFKPPQKNKRNHEPRSVRLQPTNQQRVPVLWSCWTNSASADKPPVPACKLPSQGLEMNEVIQVWNTLQVYHLRGGQVVNAHFHIHAHLIKIGK